MCTPLELQYAYFTLDDSTDSIINSHSVNLTPALVQCIYKKQSILEFKSTAFELTINHPLIFVY